MAPFRWPMARNDLQLAMEVAARRPVVPADWDTIAQILSQEFSSTEKVVELTGRACREHLDRLLKKFEEDDKKALKK